MNENLKFVFVGHDVNLREGEVLFNFSFKGDKNIDFTEKLSFPPVDSASVNQDLINKILDNLMLILGISYWKAYCPKKIVIESNFLTREQAEFWNTVWTKGLGEFFYKNKLDFRGLINFPFDEKAISSPVNSPKKDRSLLGIGGGKDSIVVAEMLKKQGKEFGAMIDQQEIKMEVSRAIGKNPIIFKRELDPKLIELNKKQGVYNGHIPISVVYAFWGLLACALYDYSELIVGNEKSANFGNVEYLGQIINHQWSKSQEFENLFRDYVKNFITPDIGYSSPLRQMTELQVVEEFVKYPKYFRTFSSCNRNFKIVNPSSKRWCGECAKCLFVFICLAAFISKEALLDVFGKNLFDDGSLTPLFDELTGVKNFKPFDCVGTPEEVKEALEKIKAKKKFNDSELLKHYEA